MDNIYKQVIELQNKFRGYIDQPNSLMGVNLRNEIQRLEDDVQTKKNKGSLEARAKGIVKLLDNADSSVMDDNHIDDLRDRCLDLIQDIRKL
jgi:hypothetical protein